jgi:hypothetical protein
MRRVNWTLVLIAALILVSWIAWQTILSLAAETRSFLVGLLAGALLIASIAIVALVLITRQQAAVIEQMRAHIGEAHRLLAARSERAAMQTMSAAPPSPPPPPLQISDSNGQWDVEYD